MKLFVSPIAVDRALTAQILQIRRAMIDGTGRDSLACHVVFSAPRALRLLLLRTGYWESRWQLYAKNPASTALGIWQLVNASRNSHDYLGMRPDRALTVEARDAVLLVSRWLHKLRAGSLSSLGSHAKVDQSWSWAPPEARKLLTAYAANPPSQPGSHRITALRAKLLAYLVRSWAIGWANQGDSVRRYFSVWSRPLGEI